MQDLVADRLKVSEITVGARRRKTLDAAKVDALADSIAKLGLLQPIVVTSDAALVAGRHRLEACRKLGLAWIDVNVVPEGTDALTVELAEIDENLVRNDLTALEQGEHLRRRDEILAELGVRAESGAQPGNVNAAKNEGEKFSPSFRTTAAIAAEVGLSERSAQQRKQAANLPEPVRDAIRDTPTADKQSELLKLTRMPEAEQQAVVEKLVSGEADNVKHAVHQVAKEHAEQLIRETDGAQGDVDTTRAVLAGQWWALGKHRLFCGDSASDEFMTAIDEAAFSFADPPYGEGVGDWDGAFLWGHDWLSEKSAVVAVTPGIVNLFDFARKTAMPYRWTFTCWLNNGMTRGELGFGNCILVPLFSHSSLYRNAQDFMQVSISVADTSETDHRGRKPTGLVAHLMKLYSEEEQTVVDPFLGSGTTLLVAEKLGRQCIGAEIEPEFCLHIIARWEALTGMVAEEVVPT
jgi:ParB-like chromosome segregation protein Spo0J